MESIGLAKVVAGFQHYIFIEFNIDTSQYLVF
jgi:hypothetical protein